MKQKIWQRVIQFFADLLLVVLAGDLLFLYYRGRWSDPIIEQYFWLNLLLYGQ